MIFLHIDVDNLWMYEEEFGVSICQDKEFIYKQSLPVLLKLLNKTRSRATFMIIGKDLTLPACKVFCQRAIALGHEIANHTWSHPVLFNKLSVEQKKRQILKTHKEILKICGKKPVGFRAPGYYLDQDIVKILWDLGYRYDSSVLPGFGSILMSAYSQIKRRQNSNKVFGNLRYLFHKDNPSLIKKENLRTLFELPISILPILRLPIHTTFVYSFGALYHQLVINYLSNRPKYLLYLLHAIDFADLPIKKNSPVIPLRYSFNQKITLVENVLKTLVRANGNSPLHTSKDFPKQR